MSATKPTPTAETGGTEITRFNALRHGVLSRYTVYPGRTPTSIARWSRLSLPSTRRRDQPRSIWLKNWPASYGANVVCDWPRQLLIIEDWKKRYRHSVERRKLRWHMLGSRSSSEDVGDVISADGG